MTGPDENENDLIWQPYPQGGILGWLFVMAERHWPVYWLTVPLWWARWRIWRWRMAAPFEYDEPRGAPPQRPDGVSPAADTRLDLPPALDRPYVRGEDRTGDEGDDEHRGWLP